MKLFMHYLAKDARVWYKAMDHGSISSLKRFHMAFNHLFIRLYPSNILFEDCCTHFDVENISEVNDIAEDVCGAPLQQDIYMYQKALPNDQEREERDIIKMQINLQRSYLAEFDDSPSYDSYDSNVMLSNAGIQ